MQPRGAARRRRMIASRRAGPHPSPRLCQRAHYVSCAARYFHGGCMVLRPGSHVVRPARWRPAAGQRALGQRFRGGSWVAVCGQPHTSSLRAALLPAPSLGARRRPAAPTVPTPAAPPVVTARRSPPARRRSPRLACAQRCGAAGAVRPGSLLRVRGKTLSRADEVVFLGGRGRRRRRRRRDDACGARPPSTCACRSAPRPGRSRSSTATARSPRRRSAPVALEPRRRPPRRRSRSRCARRAPSTTPRSPPR